MENKSVKKSPEKSKKVLEAENGPAKILHKKDQHVYNYCYELRSRAIKQTNLCNNFQTTREQKLLKNRSNQPKLCAEIWNALIFDTKTANDE